VVTRALASTHVPPAFASALDVLKRFGRAW
jgi:hypothetical protein